MYQSNYIGPEEDIYDYYRRVRARKNLEGGRIGKLLSPKSWGEIVNPIIRKHPEHYENLSEVIRIKTGWERLGDRKLLKTEEQTSSLLWICDLMWEKAVKNRKGKANSKPKRQTHSKDIEIPPFYDEFELGLSKIQDIMIAWLFDYGFRINLRRFHVEFTDYWGEGLEVIAKDHVHAVIHNLPAVLAYNTEHPNDRVAFVPLLTFEGYILVIRRSFIRKVTGKDSWDDLNTIKKSELLSQANVILEKKTDIEWRFDTILKDFKIKAESRPEVTDMEIHAGKKAFLSDSSFDIYVTNSIHGQDFRSRFLEDFDVVSTNTTSFKTRHRNLNGLVFKKAFLEQYPHLVKAFVESWYVLIIPIIKLIKDHSSGETVKFEDLVKIDPLVNLLNQFSDCDINRNGLLKIYHLYTHYFGTLSEGFLFYEELLTRSSNKKALQHNFKMAEYQLGGEKIPAWENEVQSLIDDLNSIKARLDL